MTTTTQNPKDSARRTILRSMESQIKDDPCLKFFDVAFSMIKASTTQKAKKVK